MSPTPSIDAASSLPPPSSDRSSSSSTTPAPSGQSPLPHLDDIDVDTLRQTFETNVVAPLALYQLALPHLGPGAVVINITSDAAIEGYPGWGGYGATKAALEQAGRVLAAERPDLRVLTVDPGDMRTEMHQDAFPGEDISDRPLPEASVPGIVALIEGDQASGRYVARERARLMSGGERCSIAITPVRAHRFR